MLYTLDVPFIKKTGQVIGIIEYSIEDKWLRTKNKVGTYEDPLTDEMLNAFIEEYLPDEICFLIKDKRGNERKIDFSLADLECFKTFKITSDIECFDLEDNEYCKDSLKTCGE